MMTRYEAEALARADWANRTRKSRVELLERMKWQPTKNLADLADLAARQKPPFGFINIRARQILAENGGTRSDETKRSI